MKTVLSFFILLIGLQIIGQKNIARVQESTFKTAEEVEGLYFMHGIQVNNKYCYIGAPGNCTEGEVISSDTLQTSFVVYVESRDSLLVFNGLEGAATKVRYLNYNGGAGAYYGNCIDARDVDDCASARLDEDSVTFNLESFNGAYYGEGIFKDDGLSIEGTFYYRGAGADYFLKGTKIEEEL